MLSRIKNLGELEIKETLRN